MLESIVVIMGLLGIAKQHQIHTPYTPQQAQQYFDPQTGKYYIYYNGYIYEQNVSQYQGYQNQPTQNMGVANGPPQPSIGQWYPQQQAQTPAYQDGNQYQPYQGIQR